MNKICTSIEQSKKLIELGLDVNTADIWYQHIGYSVIDGIESPLYLPTIVRDEPTDKDIPAWSLAALLGVLEHPRCFQGDKPTYWFCGCFGKDELYHEVEADNPVDACVEMIIRLHKQNLL